MDFYLATAFADLDHYLPMARAADEAGWTGMALSDHLVFPERIDSPYPYVSDGKPYWPRDAAWPDPWVTAAAMAARSARYISATDNSSVMARSGFLASGRPPPRGPAVR